MKDDQTYIKNILDSIEKIEQFTKEINKDDFLDNQMMQSAVILQPALIGEEAKKVSDATKSKVALSWKEIVGFRNMAVHEYMNLDLGIVWDTIQTDISIIKKELSK